MHPAALRIALERQQSELAPIVRMLSAAATFPPRLRPEDWRGEAAEAADRLEQQLHRELRSADSAASAAARATRAALHELAG